METLGRYVLSIGASAALLAGCGGLGQAQGQVQPTVAMPPFIGARADTDHFLYVTNYLNLTGKPYDIDGYRIDSTGKLTPMRLSPFVTGIHPTALAIYGRQFVYVPNEDGISGYAIKPGGALEQLRRSPFPGGTDPRAIAIDQSGNFAYVANAEGGTYAYAINTSNGELTEVENSPAVGRAHGVAIDSSGRFAYFTVGDDKIAAYTIDAKTGVLKQVKGSPFAAGQGASAVAVDPTGKFVYATDSGSNTVSGYAINVSDGALTPVQGSPFAAEERPVGIAVDPNGKVVYVVNDRVKEVSAYAIDPKTGALTQVHGSPFRSGRAPRGIAIDPTGKFLYVPLSRELPPNKNVAGYDIDAKTGSLTPSSLTEAGLSPNAAAITP